MRCVLSCFDHNRTLGLRQIKDGPRTLRLLEAARLLRDRSAEVRGAALTVLDKGPSSKDRDPLKTALKKSRSTTRSETSPAEPGNGNTALFQETIE